MPKSGENRGKLVKWLAELKEARTKNWTIVFFGDGTFSSTYKKHIAVPKKKLV